MELKKFITAVLNYFPKDMYIVHNRMIIGGNLSELETCGSFILLINDDVKSLFEDHLLKQESIYYINNIRAHKEDFFESLEKVHHIDKVDYVKNKIKMMESFYLNAENWNAFKLNEKQVFDMFEEKVSIAFAKNDIPDYLIISKSMIPGITKTNYSKYKYSYVTKSKDEKDLDSIVLTVDTDYFTSYMIFFILVTTSFNFSNE